MKKKLLFIGIIMNSAGTEKSFLSLASQLDFNKYDVDLLLAKKEGDFMDLIPPQINVLEMPEYGEFFLLSGKNAVKNILNVFVKKNPFTFFEVLPYFLKIILFPKKKVPAAIALWCKLLQKFPSHDTEYDAAVAYWGDRTMFYMIDKVPNVRKKIAWMHFEYNTPPYDDGIYLKYFSACDHIVNVSNVVDESLKVHLPQIAGKCSVIENIQNVKFLRKMSLENESYPDHTYTGYRILTIGRISRQKGCDFIPHVLKKLKDANITAKWYIIGGGEDDKVAEMVDLANELDVASRLVLLGVKKNPYPYLRDCTIYVQPSRFEGKPLAVEEAKILRVPIIVANYMSASEQLNNGEYGIICKAEPDDIFKSVKKLLLNPDLCSQFIQALSKKNFGTENEIEKFYELLDD